LLFHGSIPCFASSRQHAGIRARHIREDQIRLKVLLPHQILDMHDLHLWIISKHTIKRVKPSIVHLSRNHLSVWILIAELSGLGALTSAHVHDEFGLKSRSSSSTTRELAAS